MKISHAKKSGRQLSQFRIESEITEKRLLPFRNASWNKFNQDFLLFVNSQYRRVSRRRICLIYGKPDWCSYTPDGRISFCARVINGADRISRTGWGVFYHENPFFRKLPIHFSSESSLLRIELAPIKIRDFTYRKLIELSPAANSIEVIDGSKGLRERKIIDFESYGSLPKHHAERDEISKIIRQLLNQEFPDFVRSQKSGLTGLPGFWVDKHGNSRLWLEKDLSNAMLLIPYRDENGLIQACQIRLMGDLKGHLSRYLWLSTPRKNNGLSCGSPLHFVCRFSEDSDRTILVTEGALKAATAQIFYPELNVVALAGVSCSHDLLINLARQRPLLIAFDSDSHKNQQVGRHLVNLMHLRIMDSSKYNYDANLKVLVWSDKFKGIDDALLNNVPIEQQLPSQWMNSVKLNV